MKKNFSWQVFSEARYSIILLMLLAIALHAASALVGHFYADDFIQRAYAIGSSALSQQGLLTGIESNNVLSFVKNQFNFFDPATSNYQALKEFGILPWWSEDGITLHFFRPLASLTHFIEYQLYPDSPRIMHLFDLAWYALGLLALYKLYQRLELPKTIITLALLLFILNINMFHVITWIASRSMLMVVASGVFCLYCYHRGVKEITWYWLSLAALAFCLFSAEASLAICAYLAAYFFTVDERPWLQRIKAMLPLALLSLAWLIAYQLLGFGAKGGDFYLDPGADATAFLQHALHRLPASFFELASGTALLSGQIRPDIRSFHLAFAGLPALAFITYLLWPQLKQNKVLRFFLLGSVLSLIPGLTIVLSPRIMILPSIGFSVVLAYLLTGSASGIKKWLLGLSKAYIALFHIIAALLLALIMNWQSYNAAIKQDTPHGYVDLGIEDFADKHIIALNSLQPFWFAFIAHQLDYNQQELPQSIRLLSSNFHTVTIRRLSESSFSLEGKPFLQYDKESLLNLSEQVHGHHLYLTWELMGIFRSSKHPWFEGQQFNFADMDITVEKLHQNKPQRLHIQLHKDIDQYRFIFQDSESQNFLPMPELQQGESFAVNGAFNAPSKEKD